MVVQNSDLVTMVAGTLWAVANNYFHLFIHDFFQQGSFIQLHWKSVDMLFNKALHNAMTEWLYQNKSIIIQQLNIVHVHKCEI